MKIIVILIATLIMLIRTVGKERINRKMMIFLSSVIVLSSILMIVGQLTHQEIILFSFLEISSYEDNFIFIASKFAFEIILSIIILAKVEGEAKFKQDCLIFLSAMIVTQTLIDYPMIISRLVEYNLFWEVLFTFLYLFIASLACREQKRITEK